MMKEQGLVYIHKIQTTKTPLAIYEMFKIPNRPKPTNIHLYPNYTPKTKILKNSIFYKFSEIYANLPDTLKISLIKKFKVQIKIYIKFNINPYSFPSNSPESDSDS